MPDPKFAIINNPKRYKEFWDLVCSGDIVNHMLKKVKSKYKENVGAYKRYSAMGRDLVSEISGEFS